MKQIRIKLTDEEYKILEHEAESVGLSVSELLRKLVVSRFMSNPEKPWMNYAGMVRSRDPNSSQHIDKFVYGGPENL